MGQGIKASVSCPVPPVLREDPEVQDKTFAVFALVCAVLRCPDPDAVPHKIDHVELIRAFEGFGESQCVDSSRAACGEIVYEICRALGPVSPEIDLPA